MRSLFVLASFVFGVAYATPLDDYVNKYDPTYRYEDTGITVKGDGFTSYYINMTSQTWLSCKPSAAYTNPCFITFDHLHYFIAASEVTRSVWWHYLVITIPDNVQHTDTGFLYITGGSNDDSGWVLLQSIAAGLIFSPQSSRYRYWRWYIFTYCFIQHWNVGFSMRHTLIKEAAPYKMNLYF